MLKAYAVALVLSTSTPVADKNVEAAKAPEQTKAPATTQIKKRPSSYGKGGW